MNILESYGIITNGDLNLLPASTLDLEVPVNLNDTAFCFDVKVGACTYISGKCEIHHTDIGRFCSIGQECKIRLGYHKMDWLSTHPFVFDGEDVTSGLASFGPYRLMRSNMLSMTREASHEPIKRVKIGNDVWIGTRAIVMAGVSIGDGAVIGAGAIVTKDVKPFDVVVGAPAKKAKRRFPDDVCERILKLRWWDYDLSTLQKRIDFSQPKEALDLLEEGIATTELKPFRPMRYLFVRKGDNIEVSNPVV